MNIDIVYSGFMSQILIKCKSLVFFNNNYFTNRNNVFISNTHEHIFHIKKNSINVFLEKENTDNIKLVSNYLSFVFDERLFGIKTESELLYNQLKTMDLNVLRM